MTPEERANRVWQETQFHEGSGAINDAIAAIAKEIKEAVTAEREACAKLADEYAGHVDQECDDSYHAMAAIAKSIAAEIRNQQSPVEPTPMRDGK